MKEKKAKRSSGGISWIFGYLGFGVGAIGMDLSYGLFNSFLTKYLTDVLLLNATFCLSCLLSRVYGTASMTR